MRKSHSTASNLSDISKLKISSSNTTNNLQNDRHATTTNIILSNRIKENHSHFLNTSSTYFKKTNSADPVLLINNQNYPEHDTSSKLVKSEEMNDFDFYNNNSNSSIQQNSYQVHHLNHTYNNYHNYVDNCFGAIQEEQLANNMNTNDLNNSNCLKIQSENLNSTNVIQPSSSSSSSSLNNNSHNSRTLTGSNNSKTLNYGSTISNTTMG
jgi:hypothetical protein